MSFIDSFENKFLFGLTRYLATLIVFGLIAAIVIGAVVASGTLNGKVSTKVTPHDVVEVIKPVVAVDVTTADQDGTSQSTPAESNLLRGVKLPFSLQKHFNSTTNIKILRGWLDIVPAEYHQEFIDEMAAAVGEAEKQNLDASEAINTYKQLKFKKLEQGKSAKAELDQMRMYYAAAAGSCIALMALFSLILVLLAIERNTRRAQA